MQPSPNPKPRLSRRGFLHASVGAGGALLLGLRLPIGRTAAVEASDASLFAPNAFVQIDPGGQVTLTMSYVEMGQGTYTAIATLIAEELEVDPTTVRLRAAPPNEALYANPLLGVQATGNSDAMRGAWLPLRQAGAAARQMLVAAAAERWGVEPATCQARLGEVLHPATGRRLGYGALTAEAAKHRVPREVPLKSPEALTLIGRPVPRLDVPAKVNGTAVYGIDIRPPGVKVATLAQSPVFGGRLRSLDAEAALGVTGVRQVVRLADAVAVVADHMGAALKGLDALVIQWDDGALGTLSTDDIAADLHAATLAPGAVAQTTGDAHQAMANALTRVEATYELPFLAHATMEPMNCTVHFHDGLCEIWVGTQAIARAQAFAARAAGLPPNRVILHNQLIGGGFGRRLDVDGIVRAVEIARSVDGPVKVIWTREEDIQHDMYRPYWHDRIAAGLDDAGRLTAWTHRFAGSSVAARWLPAAFKDGLDPDSTEGAVDLVYDIPNFHVEFARVEPPGIPTAFWRSVGPSHNSFVTESFVDEIAHAAGQDPLAFRRALLAKSPRARAVLDLAAEKAGWGGVLPARVGQGLALQHAFGSLIAIVATVEISPQGDIRVRRVVCAVDCGLAVNPDIVEAQVQGAVIFGITAALYGEITLKRGRVEQANFDTYQMLRIDEAPAIEVHIVPSTEAPGGIGEVGTSAIMPALANAVFAATGTRLRRLPFDAAKLKA